MDRQTTLFFVAVAVVFVVWATIQRSRMPVSPDDPGQPAAETASQTPTAPASPSVTPELAGEAAGPAVNAATRVRGSSKTIVRSDTYEVELADATASVVSWRLSRYPVRTHDGKLSSEPLDMVSVYSDDYACIHMDDADLVWTKAAGKPGDLVVGGPGSEIEVAYVATYGSVEITKTFRFHGAAPDDPWRAYAADIELSFRNTGQIASDAMARGYALRWGPGVAADQEPVDLKSYGARGGLQRKSGVANVRAVRDQDVETPGLQSEHPESDAADSNSTLWAAMHSKYFVIAMLPGDVGSNRHVEFGEFRAFPDSQALREPERLNEYMKSAKDWVLDDNHLDRRKTQLMLTIPPIGSVGISDRIAQTIRKPADSEKQRARAEQDQVRAYSEFASVTAPLTGAELRADGFFLEPGAERRDTYRLYAGPKDTALLKHVLLPDDQTPAHLEQLVNFGAILGGLGKALLWVLKFFHAAVRNYGVAIIVLTILVRLAMYPITQHSSESMKRMQTRMKIIQPELDAAKQKYRDDPQRMNAEMMKVYSKYGVNPAGQLSGCLMLVLQMPIFIAMYRMLGTAAELRGAPFVLWMDDLTAPDALFAVAGIPIRVLPLAMTAGTILQQKMNPATTSVAGTQKTMMYVMPLMLLFIFYGMPSGLNLYWGVSTFIGVGQQFLVNKFGKSTGEENLTAADLERMAKQKRKQKRRNRASSLVRMSKQR
ncbi:membrane protein insertase YidC [Candidatus Poribacteria bacterium]|nr:membrane protein insertase YidC [Candidatus Poribacteria bacterium]